MEDTGQTSFEADGGAEGIPQHAIDQTRQGTQCRSQIWTVPWDDIFKAVT